MKTLKDFQKEVAIKYKLGEQLVMGHRKTYFDEATIEFTKYHVEEALKAAAYNAETYRVKFTNDYEVNKDSILESYPLINIK
jgi:hypothetical protein